MASHIRRVRRSAPSKTLDLFISVSVQVTEGKVSEDELLDWLRQSIRDYHTFRNGWVGLGCVGKITLPAIVQE